MNDWIKFNGGTCPVPNGTRVDVRLRKGDLHENQKAWGEIKEGDRPDLNSYAAYCYWRHDGYGNDIVEYKLTDPATIDDDPVNRPTHYTAHPSGIECIQITEHMGFNLGNAVKYVWRADLKGNAIQDLEKAVWYIQREIAKRKNQ